MNPLRIFWTSGRELFDDFFLLMGINLLWLLMVGPLFTLALFLVSQGLFVYAILVALLNVLLLGPANAGIMQVAERITDGRVAAIATFFEGMRQYRNLSWKVYGLWMLGFIACASNVWFYVQMTGTLGVFLTILFSYLLAIWCTLLIYLGPLILLQNTPSIRLIWRNAAVLTFGKPVFTLITAVMMVAIIGLSLWVIVLALLMTFSFLALWSMRSTKVLVADAEARLNARNEEPPQELSGERVPRGQVRPRK